VLEGVDGWDAGVVCGLGFDSAAATGGWYSILTELGKVWPA
jgi:hypothetical protein